MAKMALLAKNPLNYCCATVPIGLGWYWGRRGRRNGCTRARVYVVWPSGADVSRNTSSFFPAFLPEGWACGCSRRAWAITGDGLRWCGPTGARAVFYTYTEVARPHPRIQWAILCAFRPRTWRTRPPARGRFGSSPRPPGPAHTYRRKIRQHGH